jgi:hypothetical protein
MGNYLEALELSRAKSKESLEHRNSKILEMWETGQKSASAIAKELKCSAYVVRKLLSTSGVQFDGKHRGAKKKVKRKKIRKNPIGREKFWISNLQILRDLIEGAGHRETAKKYERSPEAVSRAAAFSKLAGFDVFSTRTLLADRPHLFYKVTYAIYSEKADSEIAREYVCDQTKVQRIRKLMQDLAIII